VSAKLTRAYLEAVRACTPEDCGDCILKPTTNRACHMVDVDPRDEAALALRLAEALMNLMIEANDDAEMNADERACNREEYTEMTNQPAMLAARSLLAELEG
jgi:hypothetical protein